VYFYWHATNGPGCSDVDSVLVTFYEIPQANAGLDTSICGKYFKFDGSWSIDNPTGLWTNMTGNPGNANFSPNNVPTAEVTVTQYGTYHFVWREMNAGNTSCYDTDTITVNFLVVPEPDAGNDTSVCGKFVQLHAHPSIPGGQWSSNTSGVAFYANPNDPGPTPSEASNPNAWIRFPSENQYVTMYWTEFNGVCYGYDSVTIYFGAIIEAIIQTNPADSLVCGPNYTLLSAVPPSYGYGYWIDTVPNTTFSPSPQSSNNLVASIDTGGTSYYGPHHFYWITVNGNCRDTSDVLYVRFIEQPRANAGGNYWPGLFGANSHIKTDTVCGLSYEMNAQPSVGIGTWYSLDTMYVYFVNGFGSHISTHVPDDSLYITNPSGYTVYSLTKPYKEFVWQETNDICTSADTLRLYFAPRPSGTFTTTMPACRHDSSMLVAYVHPTNQNIDYGVVNFYWTYPGGYLSPSVTNANNDTIYVWWPSGDVHTVTLITQNKWGCYSGLRTGQVIEPPIFNPTSDITAATCGNCNGKVELSPNYTDPNGVVHNNYYTFNWLDISSPTLIRTELCPGNYPLVVNGQSVSPDAAPGTICHDTIMMVIPDTGYVYAMFDTLNIEQMQAAPYTITLLNLTQHGWKYSWRVYDDKNNLVTTSTSITPTLTLESGCYRIVLIATSREQCRDTFEYKWLCVDSRPILEIPNVFTPNGDGQNDEWLIHGEAIVEFKGIVYNRWGKKVFEWDDVSKGWNGKINGNGAEASPGVYYYIITAKDKKGKEYEEKGYFYLLREKK
jgi:gliding motility-associated-like protein